MKTPTTQDERRRLNVLWQYEVLDTVPEELFDDLTELAARICEAPIALISLVDEKRQWFKSRVGTDLKETSRDVSFPYRSGHRMCNGIFRPTSSHESFRPVVRAG